MENPNQISTIKPGILVSIHATITGGRTYETRPIEEYRAGTAEVTRWETARRVDDTDEWSRAEATRAAARAAIVRACLVTDFGALCPIDNEADLWPAIEQARKIAADFNATARFSQVRIRALPARIAPDDAAAARAITGEMAALILRMESAIAALDIEAVRDAANRARRLAQMLDPAIAAKAGEAVEAARKIARDLVRRAQKGAESATSVLASLTWETSTIANSRCAFLDMETAAASADQAAVLPATDPRAVELMPAEEQEQEQEQEPAMLAAGSTSSTYQLDLL